MQPGLQASAAVLVIVVVGTAKAQPHLPAQVGVTQGLFQPDAGWWQKTQCLGWGIFARQANAQTGQGHQRRQPFALGRAEGVKPVGQLHQPVGVEFGAVAQVLLASVAVHQPGADRQRHCHRSHQ